MAWARRGGGKFTPDKYQLIHFTRRRNADIQAVARIKGFDGEPADSLRVLGVWVDRKLKWTAHVQEAARKGAAQFEAMSRVVGSTWGPSFNKSRLLYTAVVRPTMTYGCKIWASGEKGGPPPASLLQPLVKLQNKCLRRVTGAYKRAPVKTLEKDTAVKPLPLHTHGMAMQHALRSEAHPVTGFIKRACDRLWSRHQPRRGRRPRRPPTPMENLLSQAKATARDVAEACRTEAERRSRRHNGQRRGRQREAGDQQGQRTRTAKELISAW